MIHVITVHYGSPRWIGIQTRYLRRHLSAQYKTWTSLEGIDPSNAVHFDHVIEQRGPHGDKLNHLALEVIREASDDDLLMFLDGDAFPIDDPMPLISAGLEAAPLLAVRRVENFDDPQPHPCFCVTRCSTWRDLPGDWSKGYSWTGPSGEPVTDVGANLLRQLELTGTPWVPVLRTQQLDVHPVFFGIYGNAIYHHGAGFRRPIARSDLLAAPRRAKIGSPTLRPIAARLDRERYRLWKLRTEWHNRRRSEEMFRRIQNADFDALREPMSHDEPEPPLEGGAILRKAEASR